VRNVVLQRVTSVARNRDRDVGRERGGVEWMDGWMEAGMDGGRERRRMRERSDGVRTNEDPNARATLQMSGKG